MATAIVLYGSILCIMVFFLIMSIYKLSEDVREGNKIIKDVSRKLLRQWEK